MTSMPTGLNATDNHKFLKSEVEKLRRRCMTYRDVCDPNEVKSIEIITSVITEVQQECCHNDLIRNHCRHLLFAVVRSLSDRLRCHVTPPRNTKKRIVPDILFTENHDC